MASRKINQEVKNRMFLDYCTGMSHEDIAKKYDIGLTYVAGIIKNNGWKDKKYEVNKGSFEMLQSRYIDASNELLDEFFTEAYYLFDLWKESVHDKEGFMDKQGKISQYKLGQAIANFTQIRAELNSLTGVMDSKDMMELQLKYGQLDVKKSLAGINDTEEVQDNFADVLAQSIAKAQMMAGGDNGEKESE